MTAVIKPVDVSTSLLRRFSQLAEAGLELHVSAYGHDLGSTLGQGRN